MQAYYGRLPPGEIGIEFETMLRPNQDGHPFIASWSGSRTGVVLGMDAISDRPYAEIRIRVTKIIRKGQQ